MFRTSLIAIFCISACSTAPVLATQVVGQTAASAKDVKQEPRSTTSTSSIEAAAMRIGMISAIGKDGRSAVIAGKTFRLQPPQTRVFRNGLEVGLSSLRAGTKIRFNLSPADSTRTTIGVIHVQ